MNSYVALNRYEIRKVSSTCDVIDSVDDRGRGVDGIRLGMAHSQRRRTELNVVDGSYCHIIFVI